MAAYGHVESIGLGFPSLLYFLFAFCTIFPPKEFVSAGITIENLLHPLLGSEDLQFIQYHIRRTSAVCIVHSFLPIGYLVSLLLYTGDWNVFNIFDNSAIWIVFIHAALALPIMTSSLVYYWSLDKWSHHPIAEVLSHHANGHPWRSVASVINVEMLRVDKFSSVRDHCRTYVTDSWILRSSLYAVNIAHERDVTLSLEGSDEYAINHEHTSGAQFLNIVVESSNPRVKPFTIRLNAFEFKDLKDKINKPINNARNIIIQQSLSDRFIEAFRAEVDVNLPYRMPINTELESCIGCMQNTADVKLEKRCTNNHAVAGCVNCYCRPMWCLSCMAKWFASRQDQTKPDKWLSSTCPCPTCRSRFCMLDVCKVVKEAGHGQMS